MIGHLKDLITRPVSYLWTTCAIMRLTLFTMFTKTKQTALEPDKTTTTEQCDKETTTEPRDKKQYLQALSLQQLHELFKSDPGLLTDVQTKFYGWVRRTRSGDNGKIMFIDVYDGTKVGALKCLAFRDSYLGSGFKSKFPDQQSDELSEATQFLTLGFDRLQTLSDGHEIVIDGLQTLSDGYAIVIDGKIVLSPKEAKQPFEFQIHRLRVIGEVEDAMKYPIKKSTEKNLVSLRQIPFMRMRSQISQCIFRIGSKLELYVHLFMDMRGVEKMDPNILTTSDCEGAGETFSISPLIFSTDTEGKPIPVGLTVSSQLPLEAEIAGLKQVYTFQKSFRAERSDTVKHLSEFSHVEYEGAFITFDKLLSFTEEFVKYVVTSTLKRCSEDIDFISSNLAPTDIRPTHVLLGELMDKPFTRIKHCDAIELINKIIKEGIMLPDEGSKLKLVKLDKLPTAGQDLASEHEKLLVQYFGYMMCDEETREQKIKDKKEFGAFVFVTHWPLKIKSFYMKQCDDGSGETESFDLLAPRVGELFGGSMREWRYAKLEQEITLRKMDTRPIQWYLELRKSGSMPHGGWGMGFARLCMLVTGAPSVRDTVAFPVYDGHCPY